MKYSGDFPSVYKITDYGKKIGVEADLLAYPNNPKIAQYPSGHPTAKFTETKGRVFKGFKFWNKWSKLGASCDVFVGTCIRAVYNKDFPAGLWKQLKYMESHADFIKVSKDNLQDGDIIIYRKAVAGVHGHICIHYKGKVKEASAKHYFGRTTDQLANRLSTKGKRFVYVFRVKDKKDYKPLKMGSQGDEVKKLQQFLNWYLGCKLKIDGDFGKITLAKVKDMQTKLGGLKVDGVVGIKTLTKMKGATK